MNTIATLINTARALGLDPLSGATRDLISEMALPDYSSLANDFPYPSRVSRAIFFL
jgi:hypothetical protein